VARELLVHILNSDPGMRVVCTARDGEESVEAVARCTPDIIAMDANMPRMNGFEATRLIMETHPVPIVIVTGSLNIGEVETSFRAMQAGALTVLQKPQGIGHPDYEAQAKELITTLKLMAEVKVVRRFPRAVNTTRDAGQVTKDEGRGTRDEKASIVPSSEASGRPSSIGSSEGNRPSSIRIVAIGASTGGPPVVQALLSGLPANFPAAVLVVQHMASGFIEGFVEWLGRTTALPVKVAANGDEILPGRVYVAPDDVQMRANGSGRLVCAADAPENGLRPSVSSLFRSVAEVYGKNAAGILLTGMGKDGADALKQMKDRGGLTIAQDEESSVVFGMPGEAVRLGAAQYVLPPERIAGVLAGMVKS
jgi:two-component system chemotaxis response regulator CheB